MARETKIGDKTEGVILPIEITSQYPTQSELTGHDPNILHPGIFFIDLSPNAPVEVFFEDNDAAQLSSLTGDDIVLPELVSVDMTNYALVSMSEALANSITNPNNTVFAPVLNGGQWVYEQIKSRLDRSHPQLMTDDKRVPFHIKTTEGTNLGEVKIVQDFDERIRGKDVWGIEDLSDRNHTLQAVVTSARRHGAASVRILVLVNKIGVVGKLLLPEIQIVGFGIPFDKWVGGGGADYQDNIGRNSASIRVKMTRSEWEAYQNGVDRL